MANIIAYEFFRNALLGGLLVSILCAMVGTYVVWWEQTIVWREQTIGKQKQSRAIDFIISANAE